VLKQVHLIKSCFVDFLQILFEINFTIHGITPDLSNVICGGLLAHLYTFMI